MAFDTFEMIGKLIPINSEKIKGYESRTSDSGYNFRTTKFSVKSGTNNIIVQVKGSGVKVETGKDGKIKPVSGQKIYSRSKGDANSKGENIEIPFAERKDKSWLDRVAVFKKYIIDTEPERSKLWKIRSEIEAGNSLTDEQYALLGVSTIEEAKAEIENRARDEYLCDWDYALAVNKFIGTVNKDDVYKVSGNVEITYDANTNTPYKNYNVTKIERVHNDTANKAIVTMDVYFNKDSLDVTDWVETKVEGKKTPDISGKAIVNGKQRFYCKDKRYNIEGTFAADVVFEIPGKNTNYGIKNTFAKKFENVKWKAVRLNLNIIDGAEVVELTEDMLTEDQLIDIECGAYTLEDIKKDMGGNIYGERVRKYTFGEITNKSKGVEDTDFEDEDMVLPHSAEITEEDEDVFDEDEI